MNKQSGVSHLLAAAASLLVVGILAVGTPALAQSEEDLAAPPGSFVSTMAVPPASADIRAANSQPAVFYGASEEDAAVPQGSFTTAMAVPEIEGEAIKVAHKAPAGNLATVNLSEIVAAGLE